MTPTVRKEGLELVTKALKRQTIDFEWVIGSPFVPFINSDNDLVVADELAEKSQRARAKLQGYAVVSHDPSILWIPDPGKSPGDYWSLYKTYNALLRRASGDLIVSWQDYTYAPPDTLERFLFHYQREPRTIVGAVGDKYEDETWQVKTWKDPRQRDDQGSFYQCFYNDIELNLSAWPREAFCAVGGFDEYLDKYSSLCGLDVLARLNIIGGWDFKLDQTIKSFSTEHGRLPDWEKNEPFNGPWQKRLDYYKTHPILNYLDNPTTSHLN